MSDIQFEQAVIILTKIEQMLDGILQKLDSSNCNNNDIINTKEVK